MLEGRLILMG